MIPILRALVPVIGRKAKFSGQVCGFPRSFMRGWRALHRPTSHRNPQSNRGSPGTGVNLDSTAHLQRPFPHAAQSMPLVIRCGIEPPAVVRDSQAEPSMFHPDLDAGFGSAGMPHDIVHGLFEDEEDLPPQIGSHRQVLLLARRLEPKADVAWGENIAGET